MRMSKSEKDSGSKKEEEGHDDEKKMITPSSRQWSSTFKNPRIVRVSRGFGGKDRHSKVCTVRGLRDRRIRLSVPTAIQLYDLQDRLGLSQPSKVIDWLIDATKNEIDKLPPLPMLPTNFLHYFHQPSPMLANPHDQPSPNYVSDHVDHHLLSPKERERWIGSSQNGGFAAHNLFPLNSQFSVPNLPYNSNYFQLETSPNLSLSQFGGGFSFSDRTDHHQQQQQTNCSLSSSSSSQAQASSSQMYMCPSATSITPPFAPYMAPPSLENDQFIRPMNHFQNSVLMPTTLHLINSPLRSINFNANEHEIGKHNEDGSC